MKDKVRVAELTTLLIKPVQRIFKYPLFVNRLIEVTFVYFCKKLINN